MRRLLCCRTALKSAAGLLALLVLATPCSLARRSVCRAAAPTPPHAAPVVRVRPDSRIVTYVRWRFGVDRFTARRIVSDVWHYARRAHVSPLVVLAVIATESHFKPQAESDVGAEGLMQVYSGTRTYQIEQNIRDGVRILRQKLAFSGGSYPRALAMYCGYFSAHCRGGARYVHTVYHWYYLFKWASQHGAAHLPRVVSV